MRGVFLLTWLCHGLPRRVACLLSSRHAGDRSGCTLLPVEVGAQPLQESAGGGVLVGPDPPSETCSFGIFLRNKNMLTKFVGDRKLEGRAGKLVDRVSAQN